MSLPRLSMIVIVAGLAGSPGQAGNIWSETVTPTGPARFAAPPASLPPAPIVAATAPAAFVGAPDFNRWNGPASFPASRGFPLFCGNGGFGFGGDGFGFSFGLFN